jgi:hypothetical protein
MGDLVASLAQYGLGGVFCGILIWILVKLDKNHREDRRAQQEMIERQYRQMNEADEKWRKEYKENQERHHQSQLNLTEILSDIKHLVKQ